MDNCQSCGMPLQKTEHFGTERNGRLSREYCCYCYKDGAFTSDCTMEEMMEHCLKFLDEFNKDNGTLFSREEALVEMRNYFPKLRRWADS